MTVIIAERRKPEPGHWRVINKKRSKQQRFEQKIENLDIKQDEEFEPLLWVFSKNNIFRRLTDQ